ncbi:MAG: metal-dependent transcriptional regulator [Chitinophagaceae bacterium]|nr:metal-dependent transcriptional regulator [Chitinophagaceae bacterium]
MNFSISEEDYIKAIYHLKGDKLSVATNDLAAELHTRPASVTDMLKKLAAKKLIHYQPYKGVMLNTEGRKIALGIVRRHRLWEYFLAEKLNFSWNEVHEVAEQLEHISSKKLIEKLDEYLGYPKFDPHGDPIPDHLGRMQATDHLPLTELPLDTPAVVNGVSDQSPEMLELLRRRNIAIGTVLEVKKKFGFDHSMEIKIKDTPVFIITEQLAQNIFVQYES